MKLVGSTLRDDLNLSTGVSSELCVEIVGDEFELLDRIQTERAEPGATRRRHVRRNHIVDGDVVSAAPSAICVKAAVSQEGIGSSDRNNSR